MAPLLQYRLPLLLRPRLPAIKYVGVEVVHARSAHVLELPDDAGNRLRLAYEASQHTLLSYEGKSYAVTADTVATTLFTNYRDISGYRLPFHVVELLDDRVFQERLVTAIEVNTELSDALFERPAQ